MEVVQEVSGRAVPGAALSASPTAPVVAALPGNDQPRDKCSCIKSINDRLDGQELETGLMLSRDLTQMFLRTFSPLIRKETGNRENRRTKPRQVAHKFCPFCGAPYEMPEPARLAEAL